MPETTMERAVRIAGAAAEYGAAIEAATRNQLPDVLEDMDENRMDEFRALLESAYRVGAEAEAARG